MRTRVTGLIQKGGQSDNYDSKAGEPVHDLKKIKGKSLSLGRRMKRPQTGHPKLDIPHSAQTGRQRGYMLDPVAYTDF